MYYFYTCKKRCLIALLSLLILSVQTSFGQIIISQYYEGSSYNKFVELTNLGSSTVDLSQYKIGYWGKSKSTGNIAIEGEPSSKIALTGTLNAGSSMIVAHSKYDPAVFSFNQLIVSGSLSFNGNDGVALINTEGTILDMGPNGVSGKDCSFWRQTSVTDPSATYNPDQWTKVSTDEVKSAPADDPKKLEYHLAGSSTVSSAKAITSFTIDGKKGIINTSNHTITFNFPENTQVTALAPEIVISNKASVSPQSGTPQNFTNPVSYTVTAEDGSQQTYQVTIVLVATSTSSLLINELDADQTGTDTHEFVELYDGGKGNTSLNGYTLVLFNGSNDESYFAVDLSGNTTNAQGFFVIGSSVVANVNLSPSGFNLQNGPDAVALYQTDNFPNGTTITTNNLVDIVVYDTDDSDDQELLAALLNGGQINENANKQKDDHSIYRSNDGAGGARNTSEFVTGIPTPGQSNTAVASAPKVELSLSATSGTEADQTQITITATASKPVSGIQNVTISVKGNQITASDYLLSNSTISIPDNSTSGSITFTIQDDNEAEANETATISINNYTNGLYPGTTVSANITIVDNDGSISAGYGTPVNPTYNKVDASYPADYYSAIENKAANQLRSILQTIVVNSTTQGQNYGDIWNILKEADENPENPNQVWLIYLEKGLDKSQQDGKASGEVWNREHLWAQSLGGFKDGTSRSADGKDVYFSTTADNLKHGHADGHHLRAAQKNENSSRSNKSFDDVNGARTSTTNFYEPPQSAKGDVARSLLYMEIRYNNLNIIENYGTSGSKSIGKLSTLLKWHKEDPVDDFEKHRNNVVYDWQNNRNPFIDYPQLVDYIWGDKSGQTWTTSSLPAKQAQTISFPNLTNKTFGNDPFALTATASSGLAVTFQIVSGPATIKGNTLSITGAGTVTVKASQIGNQKFLPAAAVTRSFEVGKAEQTISFPELTNKTFGNAPFDLTATASSGLAVTFQIVSGPATIKGNTLSISGAGSVTVKAVQIGNQNYLPTAAVTHSFEVNKAEQTITFDPIEEKIMGEDPIPLAANTSSGLQVEFEILMGEGEIEGSLLTPSAPGEFKIRAFQKGSENYNASEATQSFRVLQATGIKEIFEEQMKMYPNPATNFVNLDLPGREAKHIKLLNTHGQIIKSIKANEKLKLNIQNLPSGLYFITIKTDHFVTTKQLMIVNQ
ncbi:MAG: endonuclease [Marinifilaceae bacterium]